MAKGSNRKVSKAPPRQAAPRPSLAERYVMCKAARDNSCPRASGAVWKAPANRADLLKPLERSTQGRKHPNSPLRTLR